MQVEIDNYYRQRRLPQCDGNMSIAVDSTVAVSLQNDRKTALLRVV